jgi:diguanylate cyclase (GGDEF)-like protein
VAQYGVVRLVPDVASDPSYAGDSLFGAGAMLVAPLTTEGRGIGVLVIESEASYSLTLDDARLIEAIGPHMAAMIEVARLHQQATEAASRDGLTGLYNQRYFYERLDEELARSKRHDLDLSIAVIDIDNLKQVNDTYGHLIGDQTLKRVAHVLQNTLRASDVVARYGGDEFTVIMPQTEREEAEKVMDRVMLGIDAEGIIEDGTVFPMPTRSYGIAAYSQDGDQPTQLFAIADSRLYLAKKSKKNLSHSPAGATPQTSLPHSYPSI